MARSLGEVSVESRGAAFGDMLDALPAPVRKSQYPWPLWTNGRPWRLRRGRHFGGTVEWHALDAEHARQDA